MQPNEKIKFRWHRSGLKKSMETMVEVSQLEDLRQLIHENNKKTWKNVEFTTEIKLKYAGYDPRIDWDTWYVLQRIPESHEPFGVVGMTNGNFTENRYRDCITPGCGKTFKFQHEYDGLCPDCKKERNAQEHKAKLGNALNAANGVVK